jgi:hypothetical protein
MKPFESRRLSYHGVGLAYPLAVLAADRKAPDRVRSVQRWATGPPRRVIRSSCPRFEERRIEMPTKAALSCLSFEGASANAPPGTVRRRLGKLNKPDLLTAGTKSAETNSRRVLPCNCYTAQASSLGAGRKRR